MSLTVSPELLEKAQQGPVDNEDFIACIQQSLPYAWSVVAEVAEKLATNGGQLLRLVGSDAMRAAVERHFGVKLAFQNCHRLALFNPAATAEHQDFVSPRSQLLNQRPELVNC
jgi:hypothetical protein